MKICWPSSRALTGLLGTLLFVMFTVLAQVVSAQQLQQPVQQFQQPNQPQTQQFQPPPGQGPPQAQPPQAGPPGQPALPAALQPGHVDTARSRVYVRVGATGLGHEHGVEGRLRSGTIMLDAVNNAVNQAGELVFDLTSFTAETQASRAYVGLKGEANATDRPKITANMLGTEVLDSGRFATATYKIRQATLMPQRQPTDPSWYQFEGDLTLHGVTRPVRVQAVVEPAENMLRVRGQFSLLQTQFGIKPYSKAFGAVGVADEVKVWADLWIKAR